MRNYWLRLIASFLLITVLPACWLAWELRKSVTDAPAAIADGVMDLRSGDFVSEGKVKLNGVWLLQPGQLLTGGGDPRAAASASPPQEPVAARVPGVWNDIPAMRAGLGTATYRLRLLLPAHTDGIYGIHATSIRTSARIYVNGEPIGGSGSPGLNRQSTEPSNVPFVGYFRLHGNEAEIAVQVANYSYASGGIIYPIWFGTQAEIARSRELNLFEYWLTACGFLIPALFLLLFFRLRRREAPLLQLGVFCVCSLVYVLTHGEKAALTLLPALNYDWVLRIQLISSGFVYYFLSRYIVKMFPSFGVRAFDRLLLAVAAALTVAGLTLPTSLFSRGESLLLVCALASIAYVLYVLIRAVLARRSQALPLAASIQSVLFMIAVYLLHGFGKLEDQELLPYAIIVFSASQAYLIVARFADLLGHAERLSQRLLRLDGLKDEFMLSTSYEVREPLHSIANLAAPRERRDEDAGRDRQRLAMIESIARRLAYLVDDLIDFSLLKNRQAEYRRRAVHLQPVIRSVLALYPPREPPEWTLRPMPDDLPPLLADERRLGQIVHNLVAYAIRHAHGTAVRLAAYADGDGLPTLALTAPAAGKALEADPAEAEAAAAAFYPADATAAESAERVRLAVTRQLIELGGGRWTVSRESDGLETLRIAWPAAGREAADERAGAPASAFGADSDGNGGERPLPGLPDDEAAAATEEGGGGSLLIVDDDRSGAQVMAYLLADAGISIRIAASGAEALEMLTDGHAFDLAIVDLVIPDMSGLELVRRIREHAMLSELPILLLCEGRQPEEALAGLRAGANDRLIKPYDAAELRARVGTLLQLRSSVKSLVRTETAFLQAQIKPHFLFNAINTIMTVCRLDPPRAELLLLELSRYLRGSFDFGNLSQRVPLRSELELVRSYLAIESARFDDRLRAEFEIDGEDLILVPPLSIQPLVENAVRHGIMRKPEGGTVRIVVKTVPGGWSVAVEDDGVGMAAPRLAELGESGGVGLANIRRRLRLMYGAALQMDSRPGAGTRVGFIIPEVAKVEGDTD